MNIPEVTNYGNGNAESFESYLSRWPKEYSNIPECLIKNWIHRHWADFKSKWITEGALTWKYELINFSNETLMDIGVPDNLRACIDHWGSELFTKTQRRETWLAARMLECGTTPAPILVFRNKGRLPSLIKYAANGRSSAFFLIEGHLRTAYLWEMIRHQHEHLKDQHQVWVAEDDLSQPSDGARVAP
ncbi:hypothetical protein D5125_17285 [Magnetovirga frankeli]|uniref:hypothetical protein n=1 Tax=Magnetovirga frankeli TaxID=947516 RepID=UPI0012937FF5|nr:hypothetical protein D5125_17285 [gamma proteobacterium SS-5]